MVFGGVKTSGHADGKVVDHAALHVIRTIDLNAQAMEALNAQKPLSQLRGEKHMAQSTHAETMSTDAQVRKTAWLPIMARSSIDYRNPYQIRHTYASILLTAGEPLVYGPATGP